MIRALSISLMLHMVAGSSEAQTQQVFAEAGAASAEVKRLCGTGDIDGALNVLESHGKPIGGQQGKEILKTCFMDSTGECLLGKAKCAWMKDCLSSEGPCEEVPVAEAFLEVPGGKSALEELQATMSSTDGIPTSKLVAAAKQFTKSIAQPAFLQKQATTGSSNAGIVGDKDPKKGLALVKGLRDVWFDYLPLKSQKQFVMEAAAVPLFFKLACGMKFSKKIDETTGQSIIGEYEPLGEDGPKYEAPVYEVKDIPKLDQFTCGYGKDPKLLKKWQKREDKAAKAAADLAKYNMVTRPERKLLDKAKRAKAKTRKGYKVKSFSHR